MWAKKEWLDFFSIQISYLYIFRDNPFLFKNNYLKKCVSSNELTSKPALAFHIKTSPLYKSNGFFIWNAGQGWNGLNSKEKLTKKKIISK